MVQAPGLKATQVDVAASQGRAQSLSISKKLLVDEASIVTGGSVVVEKRTRGANDAMESVSFS